MLPTCFILMLCAGCSSADDAAQKSSSTDTRRVVVETFELAAYETREITIESETRLRIGISPKALDSLPELGRGEMAIELDQVDAFAGVGAGATTDASNVFSPVDGKLRFVCRNLTDVRMSVGIYKEPPD